MGEPYTDVWKEGLTYGCRTVGCAAGSRASGEAGQDPGGPGDHGLHRGPELDRRGLRGTGARAASAGRATPYTDADRGCPRPADAEAAACRGLRAWSSSLIPTFPSMPPA